MNTLLFQCFSHLNKIIILNLAIPTQSHVKKMTHKKKRKKRKKKETRLLAKQDIKRINSNKAPLESSE